MNDVLTLSEIRSRYRDEWVLLDNPKLDKDLQVIRGKVLFHSKDRDELDRKALELRPKHSAFLYTGDMPKGTAIVL